MSGTLLTPNGYGSGDLVFSDNFLGTRLQSAYWNTFMTSASTQGGAWDSDGLGGSGVGGSYDADYDEPYEVSVDDGLTLNAVQQTVQGANYVNGSVVPQLFPVAASVVDTYGKMEFDGGYLQISMKQPSGDGSWPGLWLLPGAGAGDVGNNFEIDIQEGGFKDGSVNPNDVMAYHLHTSAGVFGGVIDTGIDLSASFNIYAIDWIPGKSITWYLNGAAVAQIDSDQAPIPDEPMELIMNNQVATSAASSWRTSLDSSTPDSMPMEIGGVQLYQSPDSGETSVIAQTAIAPSVTIATPGGAVVFASESLSGTVDIADAGSTISIFEGATQVGTATSSAAGVWSTTVSLTNQGLNVLRATASNAVGTSVPSTVDFILHTSPPEVVISTPGGSVSNAKVALSGSVGAVDAGSTIVIYDGSVEIGAATASATGGWSRSVMLLNYGSNAVTATDVNVAGTGSSTAVVFDWRAPSLATGATMISLGDISRNIQLTGFSQRVVGANGNDIVSGGLGDEIMRLGNGADIVNLDGFGNFIGVGAGDDTISAGFGHDTVVTGSGSAQISLAGYSNVLRLAGDDSVVGGLGDDYFAITAGSTTLELGGADERVRISQGASAIVHDVGSSLRVIIDSTTGADIITGLAADHSAIIVLANIDSGYASLSAVLQAFQSDRHGGSLLALGGGGSLDIAGVAPSQLSSSNFRI